MQHLAVGCLHRRRHPLAMQFHQLVTHTSPLTHSHPPSSQACAPVVRVKTNLFSHQPRHQRLSWIWTPPLHTHTPSPAPSRHVSHVHSSRWCRALRLSLASYKLSNVFIIWLLSVYSLINYLLFYFVSLSSILFDVYFICCLFYLFLI